MALIPISAPVFKMISIGIILVLGVVLVGGIVLLASLWRRGGSHPPTLGCPQCGRNLLPTTKTCPNCGSTV